MPVLKHNSPPAVPAAPNDFPTNRVPSARSKWACTDSVVWFMSKKTVQTYSKKTIVGEVKPFGTRLGCGEVAI